MSSTSPFIFDGPLPPGEVTGRDDELATLTDRAAHGRFVLLHAPRRYGKTSLVGRLSADAEQTGDLAVVRADLEGVLTIDDIARRLHHAYRQLPSGALARALHRALAGLGALGFSAGVAGFQLAPRPAAEATPVLERLLDLPYEAAARVGARILVVLDEFQAIGAVVNADALLRSRIQHQRDRVSYLFCGSEQSLLRTIFAERARPLFGQAEQIALGPLPPEVAAAFVAVRFEATGRQPGEALAALVALTAGHPQRVAFLADALWQLTDEGVTADLGLWAAALDRALSRSAAEFTALESGLEPGQRKMARVLAAGEPPTGAYAARLGLSKGGARGALGALVDRGHAHETDGTFRLVDPLYAEWVRRRS
ncbi:MAG: AAA family ATPase [Acidimicrobiales bacterium]